MASTDIVEYTFQAENVCVSCAARAVGWSGYSDPNVFIADAGRRRGIDVDDERSFDSDDWPKVIFECQVEHAEWCGSCNELLVG